MLINAAAAGVQVDFMTTGLARQEDRPGGPPSPTSSRCWPPACRIWLWEPGFFHAKTLTVDGEPCAIGTLNLDMRSLRVNKELMVWVYDRDVVATNERLFLDDLQGLPRTDAARGPRVARRRRFRNSTFRLLSHLM